MALTTTLHTQYFVILLVHRLRHSNNLYNDSFCPRICRSLCPSSYNDTRGYTYYISTYSYILPTIMLMRRTTPQAAMPNAAQSKLSNSLGSSFLLNCSCSFILLFIMMGCKSEYCGEDDYWEETCWDYVITIVSMEKILVLSVGYEILVI